MSGFNDEDEDEDGVDLDEDEEEGANLDEDEDDRAVDGNPKSGSSSKDDIRMGPVF
jgi:hypothetical protein